MQLVEDNGPDHKVFKEDGVEVTRVIYEETPSTKIMLEQMVVDKGTEDEQHVPFIHVEVKEWNKAVAEYLNAMWEQLSLQLWLEGYDRLYAYNANLKFSEQVSKQKWHDVGDTGVGVNLIYTDIERPEWA